MAGFTRREALGALAGAAVALRARAAPDAETHTLTRPIPSTREALPVIGMGTWKTFDVGDSAAERTPLVETLKVFFAAGATVIDSSPAYGRSESVVGEVLAEVAPATRPFLATKVLTRGKDEGIRQMNESFRRMRTPVMDLMQVHNLVDWKTQLDTLRGWKKEGRVRYVGITHYSSTAFDEMEDIIRDPGVDFVQLPYSLVHRDAERRLLPAAAMHGVAVLVMEPFEAGALFRAVKGRPLPDFAKDFGAASWAQLFLKWILGHPAVTCPIPASSDPKHMADDMLGGMGPVPDDAARKQLSRYLGL